MVKVFILLNFISYSLASEINKDFGKLSNLENYPKKTIAIGSLLTIFIASNRNEFDKSQKTIHEQDLLGEYSKYGDYMGQLIPNLTYMLYKNYKYTQVDDESFRARNAMFKATLYTGLTTGILKRVFNQPRPHKGDNLSFPSGHTSTAFAFAGVVSQFENTRATIGAFSIAALVGLSRMNDNAHYLHDVVFGATIGLSYGYIFSKKSETNNISVRPLLEKKGNGVLVSFRY